MGRALDYNLAGLFFLPARPLSNSETVDKIIEEHVFHLPYLSKSNDILYTSPASSMKIKSDNI